MRNGGSGYLVAALALLLLAAIVLLPSGAGPGALPREMGFWGGVHNSLCNLNLAKMTWMEEKSKTEGDLPTMEDLAPYLGEWTNHIAQFVTWGVTFKITPISEMMVQSDVATLTRNVRFQQGICRFYPAGTSYCLPGRYVFGPYDTKSWIIAFYQNTRGFIVIVLFALAIGNLIVYVIKKMRSFRQVSKVTHEHHNV